MTTERIVRDLPIGVFKSSSTGVAPGISAHQPPGSWPNPADTARSLQDVLLAQGVAEEADKPEIVGTLALSQPHRHPNFRRPPCSAPSWPLVLSLSSDRLS